MAHIHALLFAMLFVSALGARGPAQHQLQCVDGQLVAQSAAEITASGCSPDLVQLPDSGDDDFTPCCDVVSACYQICGAVQHECDKLGRRCASNLCRHARETKEKCEAAKTAFINSTTLFHKDRFQTLQNAACECVAVPSVPARYVQHFKSILERGSNPKGKHVEEHLSRLERSLLSVPPDQAASRGWRDLLGLVRTTLRAVAPPRRPPKRRRNTDEDRDL